MNLPARPSQRIIRVKINGLLKTSDGLLERFICPLIPEKPSLQIKLVHLIVICVPLQHRRLLRPQQLYFQRRYNRQRDFILNVKDVFHLTVVAFRPQMITICDVDKLRRDAQPIAGFAHAAFQHRADVQLLPDFADVNLFAFEGKGRGARSNVQSSNLRERIEQFFGQSIAEVFVVRIVADVDKG